MARTTFPALSLPRPRSHQPVPLEVEDVADVLDEEVFEDDDSCGEGKASPPSPSPLTRSAYLYAGCAALNSCNLGYDLGANSDGSMLVQQSMGLTNFQIQLYDGSLPLFASVGALLSYLASDGRWGRRGSLAASSVGFIVGIGVATLGATYHALLLGRVMVGLSLGLGLAIDPVYIAEISPPEHRGWLVTWSEIGINVGAILAFCAGLAFSGLPEDVAWKYLYGVGAILPLCMLFLVWFVMPESPRWLVMKGREEEASAVLRGVYPEGCDVGAIVADIRESLRREARAERALGWRFFLCPPPAFRRMLLVGVGTAVAQPLVGIEVIGIYMCYILDASGVKSRSSQTLALIVLGVLKLGVTLISARLFDTKGRRPLSLVSLSGMTAALVLLSLNFFLRAHEVQGTKQAPGGFFVIICLALYLCFFGIFMGPGCWLIPSEIFSSSIRAKAMGVSTFLNRLIGAITALTLLSVVRVISWGGLFALLAVACALVAAFLHHFLPETKGKTLEEMMDYFAEVTNDRSMLDFEATFTSDSSTQAQGWRAKHTDTAPSKGKGVSL